MYNLHFAFDGIGSHHNNVQIPGQKINGFHSVFPFKTIKKPAPSPHFPRNRPFSATPN
jgi:hypothetical protein